MHHANQRPMPSDGGKKKHMKMTAQRNPNVRYDTQDGEKKKKGFPIAGLSLPLPAALPGSIGDAVRRAASPAFLSFSLSSSSPLQFGCGLSSSSSIHTPLTPPLPKKKKKVSGIWRPSIPSCLGSDRLLTCSARSNKLERARKRRKGDVSRVRQESASSKGLVAPHLPVQQK